MKTGLYNTGWKPVNITPDEKPGYNSWGKTGLYTVFPDENPIYIIPGKQQDCLKVVRGSTRSAHETATSLLYINYTYMDPLNSLEEASAAILFSI